MIVGSVIKDLKDKRFVQLLSQRNCDLTAQTVQCDEIYSVLYKFSEFENRGIIEQHQSFISPLKSYILRLVKQQYTLQINISNF